MRNELGRVENGGLYINQGTIDKEGKCHAIPIKYVMFKFKDKVTGEQQRRTMDRIRSWKDVAEAENLDNTTTLSWSWVRTNKNTKKVLSRIKKLKNVEDAYIPAQREMFKRN